MNPQHHTTLLGEYAKTTISVVGFLLAALGTFAFFQPESLNLKGGFIIVGLILISLAIVIVASVATIAHLVNFSRRIELAEDEKDSSQKKKEKRKADKYRVKAIIYSNITHTFLLFSVVTFVLLILAVIWF